MGAPLKPSEVAEGRGFFDHAAEWASGQVSRAPFFTLCLALVAGWLVLLPFRGFDNQLWHLVLNSPTTAVTFLLVALLQNSQQRFEHSMNHKMNAMSDALADFMDADDRVDKRHIKELRAAVGIERRESA